MWEPRLAGIAAGWLSVVAVAIHFLRNDIVRAGIFGDSCAQYGLYSWSCGAFPKMTVWLSDLYVYFITHPFQYDASNDWIGADYASMWMGSPVAYIVAFVALNYWVWTLNRL